MVGEGFLKTIKKSLKEGKITTKQIDEACRRILEAKYKLGLFDDPFRYCNSEKAAKEILSSEKKLASREFAEHSFVLLKNNNQVLPLKKTETIALIGPLANDKNNMLGTWAVSGDPKFSVSVLEGMKNIAGHNVNILYAKGANISDDTDFAKKVNVFGSRIEIDKRSSEELLNEAITAANKSDVIVAVVGEASEMSGESASRSDISIPESQKKLIRVLAKIGKPFVLIIMSGRPLTLTEETDLASSILFTWHPGQEAGNAIADVLFGNYNPSGKLSITFPRTVGQIPIYYNHKNTGRPAGKEYQKFRSNYLDISNEPLYPFGFGLSYTDFSYSDVRLSDSTITASKPIKAMVTITNIGNYDGEETVQMYIFQPVASVTQPLKKLKGFQKIFLKKGESKTVSFNISVTDLKFFNSFLKYVAEPGDFKIYIGTNSKDVKEAAFKLK